MSPKNQASEVMASPIGTILIVEDDLPFRQLLFELLTFAGYTVITAVNGFGGLDVLHHTDVIPDLIVADVIMGRMGGCEFFEAVRSSQEKWSHIPFIMISTSQKFSSACPDFSFEPQGYLIKPFSNEALLILIQKIWLSAGLD